MLRIGKCEFNSKVDCIHECHQGFELRVRAQENNEIISNETSWKCCVSLMCDGRLLARDWMKWVIKAERWSVGPSHPEAIGRRGQPGL